MAIVWLVHSIGSNKINLLLITCIVGYFSWLISWFKFGLLSFYFLGLKVALFQIEGQIQVPCFINETTGCEAVTLHDDVFMLSNMWLKNLDCFVLDFDSVNCNLKYNHLFVVNKNVSVAMVGLRIILKEMFCSQQSNVKLWSSRLGDCTFQAQPKNSHRKNAKNFSLTLFLFTFGRFLQCIFF